MHSLQEQLSRDEKIVNVIHLLPTICMEGIMLYFSVSKEKARELLFAFARRIEGGYLTPIRGNLILANSPITSLGSLQAVGGDLYLGLPKIISLGFLQSVGGRFDLNCTHITSLGHLQAVGGDLDLYYTRISSLGNLQSVVGYLNLVGTAIKSLGSLQSVGGDLYLPKGRISQAELDRIQVGGKVFYS